MKPAKKNIKVIEMLRYSILVDRSGAETVVTYSKSLPAPNPRQMKLF